MAALARRSDVEFVHVRHEGFGAFAASADAYLTGAPVAVCGTAGPGVTHLLNGLLDAKHERSRVIVIAGDVETAIIDTDALEEVSPYDLFRTASLYTGRVVNPEQARAVFHRVISTCLVDNGPTVIALPGDVAAADSVETNVSFRAPAAPDPVPILVTGPTGPVAVIDLYRSRMRFRPRVALGHWCGWSFVGLVGACPSRLPD